MRGRKKGGALRVVSGFVLALLLLVLVALLASSFFFRTGGNVPALFGWQIWLVGNDSMAPAIAKGSAFLGREPWEEFKPGQILLYEAEGGTPAIGRITQMKQEESGEVGTLVLRGDAEGQEIAGREVSPTQVISRVRYISRPLGAFLSFAGAPWGVFLLAIVPSGLIILVELLKLRRGDPEEDEPEDEDTPEEDELPVRRPSREDSLPRRQVPSQFRSVVTEPPSRAKGEMPARVETEPPARRFRQEESIPLKRAAVLHTEEPQKDNPLVIDQSGLADFRTGRPDSSPGEVASFLRGDRGMTPVDAPRKDPRKLSVDELLALIDKEEIKLRFDEDDER